jgi:ribosomal protein S4
LSRSVYKPHFRYPVLVGFIPLTAKVFKFHSKKWRFFLDSQVKHNIFQRKGIFFSNLPIKKYFKAQSLNDKRLYKYLSGGNLSNYSWANNKNKNILSINKQDSRFFKKLGIKPNWSFIKKWKHCVNLESRVDVVLSYFLSPYQVRFLLFQGLVSVDGRIIKNGGFPLKNGSTVTVNSPVSVGKDLLPAHLEVLDSMPGILSFSFTSPSVQWLFFDKSNMSKSWSMFLFIFYETKNL